MGLGLTEILIIGLAAMVLLGPSRLPSLMRQFAKIYVHLRRTSNDFKSAFDHVIQEAEAEMLGAKRQASEFTGSIMTPGTLADASPPSTTVSLSMETPAPKRAEQPFNFDSDRAHQSQS
jgi:sec-independent protein translocase protein TatB